MEGKKQKRKARKNVCKTISWGEIKCSSRTKLLLLCVRFFKRRFILEIYNPFFFVLHPPTYLEDAFEDSFTCLFAVKGVKTCEFTALISKRHKKVFLLDFDSMRCDATSLQLPPLEVIHIHTITSNNIEKFHNKMPSTIAPHSDRLLLAAKLSSLTRKALEFATVNDEAFFFSSSSSFFFSQANTKLEENKRKKNPEKKSFCVKLCFFRCRVRIAIGDGNKFLVQISL